MSEMRDNQNKAWDCLLPTEQTALFLNVSEGRTTWELSDTLSVPHYKMLEIKARAEYLFKRLSEYFRIHPSLVNPKAPISQSMRDYIEGCIEKRLSTPKAREYAGDDKFKLEITKNPEIERMMGRLYESTDKWDQDLYALLIDFDRWNNHRILPVSYQAPSPFRRRSVRKHKKYIKFLYTIPDFMIKQLIHEFSVRSNKICYYLCLVSLMFPEGYRIIKVKRKNSILKKLTKKNLYVFDNFDDAEEFGLHVSRFFEWSSDIKLSVRFWPAYMESVQKAVNYADINHLNFKTGCLEFSLGLVRKNQMGVPTF